MGEVNKKTVVQKNNKESVKEKFLNKKRNDFFIKYFKFIALASVIFIFLLGYFFVLQKKYDEIIAQIEASGASKQDEYDAQLKKLRDLRKLKTAYNSILQTDVEKINAVLPDEFTNEDLLAQVEAIILRNGLILRSLSIESIDVEQNKNSQALDISGSSPVGGQNVAVPSEIGKIKINISVVGTDYERFKNLLIVLENNLRLMDIESLSFSPSEKSTSLSMFTYYLKK